jgi:uncharacterized membrane protein YeiH
MIITIFDCLGTFAFALSGGLLGVRKRFDLFGVLCLSFVVSVSGGIVRDVLIQALPPVAVTEMRYFVISMVGGLITFFWSSLVALHQRFVLLLDACGLALFAVVGTQKAIEYGINPLMAAILGMISGIGGGMVRDVLAGEIPFVLRADLYALAALAGGAIVSAGSMTSVGSSHTMLAGAAVCIFLRVMAICFNWRAPTPRRPGDRKR